MASNDQKTVLPSLRPLTTATTTALPSSRGGGQLSDRVEATIIVSDVGNDNAQIVVTQLPKATSNKSKTVQQVSKTVSPHSVSQSTTSGAMTGEFFVYPP